MSDNTSKDDTLEGTMPPQRKTAALEKGPAADNNLSVHIEGAVDRQPLDWVRCVRVFGDYYRCNWWSRKGTKREGLDFDWGGLITDHVRKSCFLRATMQKGQLVMEEVQQSRNPLALPAQKP